MDTIIDQFVTHDPIILYNHCLQYILLYQNKKSFLGKCLEKIIQLFNIQITEIVNICIHDIDNLYSKEFYIHYRTQYVNKIKFLLHICKYKHTDSPVNHSNKYIHNSIIQRFYSQEMHQITKFNQCILFVDKVLNINNHFPKIKYVIKGNLIENNEIIYSNVVVDNHTIPNEDDISRLPPKKRYRK